MEPGTQAKPSVPGAPGPVRELWRTPQVRALFVASLIGRLPFAVVTVLFLLRMREMGASYATGGAVLAAYAVATGASEPLIARWIDRAGQTPVLRIVLPANALAFAGAALAPDSCPPLIFGALAAVIGFTYPPIGGMLRALLVALLPEKGPRQSAFSLEAGAVETLFIGGPVLFVAGIANHAGAAAALGVAGLTAVIGATAFALLPASRAWRPHPVTPGARAAPLISPAFRSMLSLLMALGFSFGGLEVVATAFAELHGDRAHVGLLLSLGALGSFVAGVAAMRARAPRDPARRVIVLCGAQAGLLAVLAVPQSMLAMAPAMAVSGLATSPLMAQVYGITADTVPAGRLTEGYGWLGAALMLGSSVGGFSAGVLVTHLSPSTVFLLMPAPTLAAALYAAARRGEIRAAATPAP